jgi:hypothetical protein
MNTGGPLAKADPPIFYIDWNGAIKRQCWKKTKEND